MHPKTYKLLRLFLIVMLTITPLRTVTAGNSVCKMEVTDNTPSSVMMSEHATGHHNMEQHVQMVSVDDNSMISNQYCFCDDSQGVCSSNCDMGMSVSLVLQELSYASVILDVSESVITSSNILLRELTPPSRPPAAIS